MKMKTLFLGTAAAFAVTSGAQAADLALAVAPIDYVKVCDAFGTGYFYLPGTDTCLKIGGYAQLDAWYYQDRTVGNITGLASPVTLPGLASNGYDLFVTAQSSFNAAQKAGKNIPQSIKAALLGANTNFPVGYHRDGYSSYWSLQSEVGVNFTAKAMTDLGPIVAFADIRAASNNDDLHGSTDPGVRNAYADSYYGAIGPIMFGYTTSLFDPGGGYNYDLNTRSDHKTDQIRFSYLMGTWGIMLGLEDPRDRYAPNYADSGVLNFPGAPVPFGLLGNYSAYQTINATGDYPDIVLALTGNLGGVNLKVAGAVTDTQAGTGWGVSASGIFNLGANTKIQIAGAYSDHAASYAGGNNCSYWSNLASSCDDGKWWSAFISGSLALSGNMALVGTVGYQDGDGGASYTQIGHLDSSIGLRYYPSNKSSIGFDVRYQDPEQGKSAWGVHARFVAGIDPTVGD